MTDEKVAARHNIFDEFAAERDRVFEAAAGFRSDPWKLHIGGRVKAPLTFDVSELVRRLGLEERLYRHRCVETWAMAVPWTGFPLAKLVALAEPLADARYVRFVSAARPDEMPGWYATRRVFPYYEALTLPEATNELAFVATGIYGHSLPAAARRAAAAGAALEVRLQERQVGRGDAAHRRAPGHVLERPRPGQVRLLRQRRPGRRRSPGRRRTRRCSAPASARPTLPYNGYAAQVARLYA